VPFRPRKPTQLILCVLGAAFVLLLPATAPAGEEKEIVELIEGTGILLNQSDGGGSGGNTKSTSSSTNIFSPGAFVDYKRFGGEPTVTVDRYPFTNTADCAPKPAPCFKDIAYQSAPQGVVFPHYSQFWKSDDLGQTFRKSQQFPVHGLEQTNLGGGGGDSYQVVGQTTHNVFFTDLPADCVTLNVSTNLGETFATSDPVACGVNPGVDDRQWVEVDELFPGSQNVYVSFINFANANFPTLSLARSTADGAFGTFAGSPCNAGTLLVGSVAGVPDDNFASPCPDPGDHRLALAGPPVADDEGTSTRMPTHNLYIPFTRADPILPALTSGPPYNLWIAKSTDGGLTWKRRKVAELGTHNPVNLFPQVTIDRGGTLYYTWSQTQGPGANEFGLAGEQDVYYAFSTNAGETWSQPINLTPSNNDSAVMPWMIAGDPGRVDLVYYKANTGINSNFAFVDADGNECEDGAEGCHPNLSVWNVFFGQSMNATNTGSNFKNVQVSPKPNHIGQVCTLGFACEGDRDLLDFFTVDVDHLGAAHIAYSDDNRRSAADTQDYMTRQVAGNSVFKDQNITLQSSWPIRDHAVTDRGGDVRDAASAPKGACTGMDILKTAPARQDDKITITMTLDSAPTALNATTCAGVASDGGLWGAEFWAVSTGDTGPSNQFYIAYRDDANGQRVEGGTVDNMNVLGTSFEFNPRIEGTLSGNCITTAPGGGPPFVPTANAPCTIAMTVPASSLGITPGNGLYSITGLSLYAFGDDDRPPGEPTRRILGNTEQGDATAALHYLGSGTQ
jgi:hypothetical protein